MTEQRSRLLVTVLAHNEERGVSPQPRQPSAGRARRTRGGAVVNGGSDATADIVRTYAARGVELVEYAEGGKARSLGLRFILDCARRQQTHSSSSMAMPNWCRVLTALVELLMDNPQANAASAPPMNGRNACILSPTDGAGGRGCSAIAMRCAASPSSVSATAASACPTI